MATPLASYALVAGGSMLKSIVGPLAGYGLGLPALATFALSAAGMMSTVLLVTFGGTWLRPAIARAFERLFPSRPARPPREMSPRLRAIWARWGMPGIAFFTPLLLSPPGGAIAAVAFAVPRRRIVLHMLWATVAWAAIYTTAIYRAGHLLGLVPAQAPAP